MRMPTSSDPSPSLLSLSDDMISCLLFFGAIVSLILFYKGKLSNMMKLLLPDGRVCMSPLFSVGAATTLVKWGIFDVINECYELASTCGCIITVR